MIVKNRFLQVLLLGYCLLLIKVMVFKDVPLIRIGVLMLNFGGTHDGPPNFIPFKTILPYLIGEKGLLIGAINIVGNIILLVPVGLLVPFVFPAVHLKKSILFAVFSGLLIEGMQTLLHVGIFDIDDVILNGLGYLMTLSGADLGLTLVMTRSAILSGNFSASLRDVSSMNCNMKLLRPIDASRSTRSS